MYDRDGSGAWKAAEVRVYGEQASESSAVHAVTSVVDGGGSLWRGALGWIFRFLTNPCPCIATGHTGHTAHCPHHAHAVHAAHAFSLPANM